MRPHHTLAITKSGYHTIDDPETQINKNAAKLFATRRLARVESTTIATAFIYRGRSKDVCHDGAAMLLRTVQATTSEFLALYATRQSYTRGRPWGRANPHLADTQNSWDGIHREYEVRELDAHQA